MSTAALPAKAANHIRRSRLSAISDEVAASPAEAIQFAEQYGLQWLELREVPGGKGPYMRLSEAELKAAAREFADHGIRISFLNTPLLKFGLPGTEPAGRRNDTPEARQKRLEREQTLFTRRMDDLRAAIRTAHILSVGKVRIFTFLRLDQPIEILPRVAEILEPMGRVAREEGVRLLIENESSCNAATCAEAAAILKLLPEDSFGLNWDALNGQSRGETPYPDGYALLPKNRIYNVQVKGKSVLEEKEHLPWAAIFKALEQDGYAGECGLETHYFDGTKIEKSHRAMRELLRMVEPG